MSYIEQLGKNAQKASKTINQLGKHGKKQFAASGCNGVG